MKPLRRVLLTAACFAAIVSPARAADPVRPLPLCGSWNTGENPLFPGYSPKWVMDRIDLTGDPLFPQFEVYGEFQPPEPGSDYYFPALQRAAARGLPISFIGRNFADNFRLVTKWRWAALKVKAPEDSHPWQIEIREGVKTLVKRCSPFSPGVASWHEHGVLVGQWLNTHMVPAYPDPPLVLLCDNNEAGVVTHLEAIKDYRCPRELKKASKQVIEERINLEMKLRWGEFRRGLREQLPSAWQSALKFIGYGDFSDKFNGGPNPFISDAINHEGVSCSVGYTSYSSPARVRSPMVNACNVRWALDKYRAEVNPDYYLETHFYHTPNVANLDQWLGMIRGTLWITRPPTARMFFASTDLLTTTLPKFEPLVGACREVSDNPVLKRFWERGTLLHNRWKGVGSPERPNNNAFGHPYNGNRQTTLSPEFGSETLADRWFIQPTSADVRQPDPGVDRWGDDLAYTTPVQCFAIVFQEGEDYLVYATAPRGQRSNVTIHACPDGNTPAFQITVTVPVRGAFWLVQGGTATPVLSGGAKPAAAAH